ncbi:hypothetical protein CPB86DRAFT_777592 [Serendipita vermifera]|nr:hypothetical protein CPB86DRAFT_777592 [Serendipita vermifera]
MPTTRPSVNTNSPVKLNFDDKLTGRGLSSDNLQRKLKTLLDELHSITEAEPENIDLASFATVRKELIGTSLILHKDKGVKAYTACCIAELLNVYAPDAPYTANELKDIFQFFFKQLMNGLKGQDAPYYQLYHDLLASLSKTKSAVLMCDLPQAEDLLVETFRDFFSLAALSLPTPIEVYMADILSALLDECQTVPSEIVETLISQFNAKKSSGSSNPAFRLAIEVCNASSDKLVRPVSLYFTDTIIQHTYSDGEEGGDDDAGGSDFDTLQAAHTLVKRLHKYCPKLLLSVIPQLQEELAVDNLKVRLLATQTLGEMFAQMHHGSELMKEYRSTWVQWVSRKNDKSPVIRLAFVEAAKKQIGNVDMRVDIEEAMEAKVHDPDDKVRAAVCKMYGELDFETAAYHVSEKMLRTIAGRCLDKKHNVRLEAFDTVGKLYANAVGEIEKGNPTAVAQFNWIPLELIQKSPINPEVRVVAEDIIARYIFPLPSIPAKTEVDEQAWTRRFLRTAAEADQRGLASLLTMSGVNARRPTIYEHFIDCCSDFNGGVIDKDEAAIKARYNHILHESSHIPTGRFSNPIKVEDDLVTFAKKNDRRLYKHLRTCMDVQTGVKDLVKTTNEFLKIVEKEMSSIATTMHIFIRRASLWLINSSSIETLFELVSSSSEPPSSRSKKNSKQSKSNGNSNGEYGWEAKMADQAQHILVFISKHCPALFYGHLALLAKEVHAASTPASLETSLRALAAVACLGTDQSPVDSKLDGVMQKFALGSDRINAKYASRYISNAKGKEKHSPVVIKKLYEALKKADGHQMVAHIAALTEFALYRPDEFEERSEDIIRLLLSNQVVHRNVEKDGMDLDPQRDQDQSEWCREDDLEPIILAKIQSLRLFTNRCIAHAKEQTAGQIGQPVSKLLLDTLDQEGSFSPAPSADIDRLQDEREGGAPARSWIRLKAAKCLLRLAQEPSFAPQITLRFVKRVILIFLLLIILTLQDFCWEVRTAFIKKLIFLSLQNKLSPIFNAIVFLTCHDIEANVRTEARNYVVTQMKRVSPKDRLRLFEIILVRYLHLLAHHPDFDVSESEEGLPALAKYIEFYLELVANNENISLLFHLAQQCKTVRDNAGESYSNNLYLLSELTEYAIKQRAQSHGWTIPSYPNKVTMPSDLFSPLSSPEAVKKIRSTVYLTDEMIGYLGEIGKPLKAVQTKTKKRRAPNNATKTKRPVKRRKKNDDDEDDEDPSDEDDEVSSNADPPAPTSDEEMSDGEGSGTDSSNESQKLGRGARGRARVSRPSSTPTDINH